MQYFRNFEIAKLFHVSQPGVGRWISSAQQGKLDLQLYEQDGKTYIANTPKNLEVIKTLVKGNKKYVNTRSLKTITPSPHFYEVYSPHNIADIVSSLDSHHEIPLQYTYFDGGADHWDKYAEKLYREESPNVLNRNIHLLASNLDNIERLVGSRKKVNIIDIGAGNGLPVRAFLDHLIERGVLNKYIGIDESQDMLKILKRNLDHWFGDKINFETHCRDISREGFDDLLIDDYFAHDDSKPPVNVVLLFGGTLNNFRAPDDVLRQINNSMEAEDLLIYFMKLDTPNSRRFFVPFNTHSMSLDLLGIDKSWYEVEGYYDDQQRARFMRIRLTVGLSIVFELNGGKRVVNLDKDETILVWRYRHQNALDVINQLDRNSFNLLQTSKSRDNEYLLTISEIASGANSI